MQDFQQWYNTNEWYLPVFGDQGLPRFLLKWGLRKPVGQLAIIQERLRLVTMLSKRIHPMLAVRLMQKLPKSLKLREAVSTSEKKWKCYQQNIIWDKLNRGDQSLSLLLIHV